MIDLGKYGPEKLSILRGEVRTKVRVLERIGAQRTVTQDRDLTDLRRLYRRLNREIKRRYVQLPLF